MPPRKEATVPKATAPAPAPFTTAASIAPATPRVLLAQITIDTTPPAPLIRTSHAQRPFTAEAAAALASSALHLAPRTANCLRSTFSAHALPTGRPLRQETTEDSPSAPIPLTPPSPAARVHRVQLSSRRLHTLAPRLLLPITLQPHRTRPMQPTRLASIIGSCPPVPLRLRMSSLKPHPYGRLSHASHLSRIH